MQSALELARCTKCGARWPLVGCQAVPINVPQTEGYVGFTPDYLRSAETQQARPGGEPYRGRDHAPGPKATNHMLLCSGKLAYDPEQEIALSAPAAIAPAAATE